MRTWWEKKPRPGQIMGAHHQMRAKHPVVIVPGFTSCGLELWAGEPCLSSYFRRRIWGTTTMLQSFFQDTDCWLRHMKLDLESGMDPAGIKLRSDIGIDAADYFGPGYWLWGKMIENLADIGYDSSNLHMEAYDWRLSPVLLQERDHFFSRLKSTFELSLATSGERAALLAHSYGSLLVHFFFNWVESPKVCQLFGGNGGAGWVDKHIESYVNIAGPMLGVPKATSALLSGEFREVAVLGSLRK
ncbi:unnamed protein product, partial [Chrysoparadoxa australica]